MVLKDKVFLPQQEATNLNVQSSLANAYPILRKEIVITNRDINTLFRPLPFAVNTAGQGYDGSITSIYDYSLDSYYQINSDFAHIGTYTTNVILDSGLVMRDIGINLVGQVFELNGIGNTAKLELFTSEDGINWTSQGLNSGNGTPVTQTYFFDIIAANLTLRFIKLAFTTTWGAGTTTIRAYYLSVFS